MEVDLANDTLCFDGVGLYLFKGPPLGLFKVVILGLHLRDTAFRHCSLVSRHYPLPKPRVLFVDIEDIKDRTRMKDLELTTTEQLLSGDRPNWVQNLKDCLSFCRNLGKRPAGNGQSGVCRRRCSAKTGGLVGEGDDAYYDTLSIVALVNAVHMQECRLIQSHPFFRIFLVLFQVAKEYVLGG